jgi:hypothetical protein
MVLTLSVLSGVHAVSFFKFPAISAFPGDAGVYIHRLPRRMSSTQDVAAMVVGKPMVLIASTPT